MDFVLCFCEKSCTKLIVIEASTTHVRQEIEQNSQYAALCVFLLTCNRNFSTRSSFASQPIAYLMNLLGCQWTASLLPDCHWCEHFKLNQARQSVLSSRPLSIVSSGNFSKLGFFHALVFCGISHMLSICYSNADCASIASTISSDSQSAARDLLIGYRSFF